MSYTATSNEVFASVGEEVTCANGHLVAYVRRTLLVNTPADPDDFQFTDGNEQEHGSQICPCYCGAKFAFMNSMNGKLTLHVGGKWR